MSSNGLPTLLGRLSQHAGFRRLQSRLERASPRAIWWLIDQPKPAHLDYAEACKTCRFVRESAAQRKVCQRRFLKALDVARETKQLETFLCPIQRPAFVLPIVQDHQVTGHVARCHGETALPDVSVQTAAIAVDAAVRELEKDRELANLYESIQPRCVALSTIHTIHRLINSTLDFNELIPRLARLCVQVLRVNRCAIFLMDETGPAGRRGAGRRLVPKAVVDLRSKHPVERSVRVGRGIHGRVAATAQPYIRDRLLAVPLMDEDCLGVIVIEEKQHHKPFTAFDQEILVTLSEQAVVAINNARLYAQQEKVALGTIKSLAAILDTLDGNPPTEKSHARLLVEVTLALADELGITGEERRTLHYAALLHDAGRVAVPDEILVKPTRLTGRELQIVRRHPVKGVELMRPLVILEPSIPIILHHHERYDGRGYPKGLKGDEIPFGARVLAVANAFEAMICARPYRPALSVDEAAREIQRNSGTQFDPKIVEAFQRLARRRVLKAAMSHER